jgi:hypothetical protein
MTPTAVTPAAGGGTGAKRPAGRRTAAKTPAGRAAGHPGTVRKPTAPRAPRRVSGPLSGHGRGRAQARPAKLPARGARSAPRTMPLGRRAASYVRSLPDHALLDRIVRGRAWIPLLGVMLAGIVAMQVEVLKLSASMGQSIERSTSLLSRNEILRASVAGLADDQRIERLAAGMGMLMPAPDAVDFLAVGGGADVRGAIAGIHQPDATAFTALLPATTPSSGAASTTPVPTSSDSATATTVTPSSQAAGSPVSPTTTSSTAPVPATGSGPSSQAASAATPTAPAAATPAPAAATPVPPAATPAPSSGSAGQSSGSGEAGASGGASPVGG